MRWITVICIVIVFAMIGALLALRFSGGVPVDAARATRGEIRSFLDERGKTRLPEVHLVTMPFEGRIEKIALDVGDKVTKGQAVAQIMPADLQTEVDEATAAVARLQASIAENEDKQTEQLTYEQSLQMVEAMQSTVKAAENRVRSGIKRLNFSEDFAAKMRRLLTAGARSEEDVDRADVEKVDSEVSLEENRLTVEITKATLAATMILPKLVNQYIADQDLKRVVLEKEMNEAEARLRQVQLRQQRGTMHSSVDGVILERAIENERFLPGGEVLLKIGEVNRLEVEADVLSQDVVDVRPGQPVEIYGPAVGGGVGHGVNGKVKQIYPAGFTKVSSLGVEEQRVKVIIAFDAGVLEKLQKTQDLGVDYRIRARIFTGTATGAIRVPRSALFRGADNSWRVFTVSSGQARQVPVEVGLMNDDEAQITRGLLENDVVILAPETTITDGARVRPLLAH